MKHGGGPIMVRRALSTSGVGILKLSEGHMNSITYRSVPCFHLHSDCFPWARGGYSSRIMHLVILQTLQQWLTDHHVKVLPWPSQSPDMNPIENLCVTLLAKPFKRKGPATKENWTMSWGRGGLKSFWTLLEACLKQTTMCKRCREWPTK